MSSEPVIASKDLNALFTLPFALKTLAYMKFGVGITPYLSSYCSLIVLIGPEKLPKPFNLLFHN